jgi:hypothetical protein
MKVDGKQTHVVLKYAKVVREASSTADDLQGIAKKPELVKTLHSDDIAAVVAKNVRMSPEDLGSEAYDLGFETDAAISRGRGGCVLAGWQAGWLVVTAAAVSRMCVCVLLGGWKWQCSYSARRSPATSSSSLLLHSATHSERHGNSSQRHRQTLCVACFCNRPRVACAQLCLAGCSFSSLSECACYLASNISASVNLRNPQCCHLHAGHAVFLQPGRSRSGGVDARP